LRADAIGRATVIVITNFAPLRGVIVMVGGRVLIQGTPHEIASDPRVRAVYLGKAIGNVPAGPRHETNNASD